MPEGEEGENTLTTQEIVALALNYGFSHGGAVRMEALEFLPEVREMCADGRCHMYGRCWTCPPACGTLEEAAARVKKYRRGILVQSTADTEDDFDVDAMQALDRVHKERFGRLVERLRAIWPNCLPMSSGACTICKTCTYPDAPCRFPDRAIPSMEAYGLFVSRVCEQSGMEYCYGPKTLTYTACVRID